MSDDNKDFLDEDQNQDNQNGDLPGQGLDESEEPKYTDAQVKQMIQEAADKAAKKAREEGSNSSNSNGQFNKLVQALTKIASDKDSEIVGLGNVPSPVDPSEIDVDDYMEEPAEFFAWCFSTTIWDDVKNGHPVSTPYKRPIRFRNLLRVVEKGGPKGSAKVTTVCAASVHSKKEADFIRNHTLYGIKYFESTGKTKNIDVEYAQKISEVYQRISKMAPANIVHRAKQENEQGANINIGTTDIDYIRKLLAERIAQKEMKTTRARYSRMLEQTQESLDLLQSSD